MRGLERGCGGGLLPEWREELPRPRTFCPSGPCSRQGVGMEDWAVSCLKAWLTQVEGGGRTRVLRRVRSGKAQGSPVALIFKGKMVLVGGGQGLVRKACKGWTAVTPQGMLDLPWARGKSRKPGQR